MIVNMERRHLVVFGVVFFGLGATVSGFIFSWIINAPDGGQFDDTPVINKKQVIERLNDVAAEKLTNESMSEETKEKVRYAMNSIQ